MTMQPEPPRRPLRIPVWGTTGWAGEGHPYNGSIVLVAGDPGYERAYQQAALALRSLGQAMPYADMGEDDKASR